jgi:DNA (cytosine-5)-methyltransferase 1
MKILNLYAGIGGNRKLWGDNHEITAVEYDEKIAEVYANNYPKDTVIVADAHKYLLDVIKENIFDFIWSSPPCPSHSSFRQNIGVRFRNVKPIYPDLKLYEEILLLKYNFNKLWVVENVIPYYKPLIEAQKVSKHLFWSNFKIEDKKFKSYHRNMNKISELEDHHNIKISNTNLKNKRQILRNCVYPPLGKHILNSALNDI